MSETPQVDPRQGAGESRPTLPLGRATPLRGLAPQDSGQEVTPVPGQAPPPVPPQVPDAPSAWSRPVPTGGPDGPDGPGGGPRGGSARGLLIGGAAALVVAVIAGVAVATSGGDDHGTASRPPSDAPSGVPGGAAEPEEPPAKAFTEVPEGCELVRPSTVEEIVPGAVCTPGVMDDKDLASMITRSPSWKKADYSRPYRTLDAHVVVSPGAEGLYDMEKETALKDIGDLRKVLDSRSVGGLGEEAFMVHSGDADGSLVRAEVIVREGNATITAEFIYNRKDSGTTRQQSEEAVIAAARDVLASLS
ncbi:hypothetical protein GCM10010406_39810 [Streptomyces thermolineatus]|uniref:Uncharacterized protein n=1 Tax=Streptomyces thermolineatus TaxID=44033 RepID=A0ABN3MCE3_9ACTN